MSIEDKLRVLLIEPDDNIDFIRKKICLENKLLYPHTLSTILGIKPEDFDLKSFLLKRNNQDKLLIAKSRKNYLWDPKNIGIPGFELQESIGHIILEWQNPRYVAEKKFAVENGYDIASFKTFMKYDESTFKSRTSILRSYDKVYSLEIPLEINSALKKYGIIVENNLVNFIDNLVELRSAINIDLSILAGSKNPSSSYLSNYNDRKNLDKYIRDFGNFIK